MIAAIKPEPAEYHITARITPDLRFYYQLHGYKPSRDGISVFLVPGNHEVKGDTLIIYQRCSWLTEDLRCKHHDRKPTLCGSLNYKNAKQGRFTLTKGCLLEEPQ
jgi:Fe-S-cluster containining protein